MIKRLIEAARAAARGEGNAARLHIFPWRGGNAANDNRRAIARAPGRA